MKQTNEVRAQYARWQICIRKIRRGQKMSDQGQSHFKPSTWVQLEERAVAGIPQMQGVPLGRLLQRLMWARW